MIDKDYIVILQCHIVKERCSGYFCEKAFHERSGGFADYDPDKTYRVINMTCGGCCGRATQRKLSNLIRQIKKKEGIGKDRIVVQLSSCMVLDNHHGLPCPHLDYIKTLIERVGLEFRETTKISETAQGKRDGGLYGSHE